MAGNSIRISTDSVNEIAATIERLNNELDQTLAESRHAIDRLNSVWQGEAAEATISSYNNFANNYFQNYKDIITQYVQFLRNNVAQGYVETETVNVNLADSFN